MTTVLMADSVSADNVPNLPGLGAVLGYVDGGYRSYPGLVAKFPTLAHVPVTVKGLPGIRVCDCETGDLTPQQAALWAHNEVIAGRRPTIYCNLSTYGDVASSLAGHGLEFVRDVDWFCARPNGVASIQPGSIGTQYAWPGYGLPNSVDYDLSIVESSWLHQTPAPTPKPTPPPPPPIIEDDMITTDPQSGTLVATDKDGNLYAEPHALPVVPTLSQHPTWKAGSAESNGANPCIGVVFEKDADGSYGVTFVTKPTSGKGGFGPYDRYHFLRNGTPH